MSSPSTPSRGHGSTWQERLEDHCRLSQYPPPVFNIVSDRRGGRTAWSSTVLIPAPNSTGPQLVQARYWYDGQHVNNAKEDAAEVALRVLTGNSPTGSAGSSSAPGGAIGGGTTSNSGWANGTGMGGSPQHGPGSSWPRSPPSQRR